MSRARTVVSNSAVLLVFQMLGRVASFITVPLLARGLGTTGFGAYSTAGTLLTVTAMFTGLGVDTLMIREIARNPEKKDAYLVRVTLIKLLSGAIAVGLLLGLAGATALSPDAKAILRILVFTLLLDGITNTAASYFYGQQRMLQGSLFGLALSCANLLFVSVAYASHAPIHVFAAAYVKASAVVAASVLLLLAPVYIRGVKSPKTSESLLSFVRQALPFVAFSLLLMVYYKLDILILSSLLGDTAVGIYTSAYRIIDTLMFVPAAIMGALFPALSQLAGNERVALQGAVARSIKYLALLGIPAAVGVFVLAPEIIRTLYASDGWSAEALSASTLNLQVLIFAWMLVFVNAVCPVTLNSVGRTVANVRIVSIGIAVNVAANLVLVPRIGVVGASIATLLAELLGTVLYVYAVTRAVGALGLGKTLIHPVSGSILMFCVLMVARRWCPSGLPTLIILPLVGAAVYLGYCALLGIVRPSDLKLLLGRQSPVVGAGQKP